MEANRRKWNQQHALLQRLLMKEKDFRKALPIVMAQHGAVHSAKMCAGTHWSFQDEVLGALTETQMRALPKRGQSVVWKIWHATRVEDVTMNLLLAGSPQVLGNGKWPAKLGIQYMDVGNDMPEADLKKLSDTIDVKALLGYRLAVGRRTRAILRRLKPGGLWEQPAPERIDRLGTRGSAKSPLAFEILGRKPERESAAHAHRPPPLRPPQRNQPDDSFAPDKNPNLTAKTQRTLRNNLNPFIIALRS